MARSMEKNWSEYLASGKKNTTYVFFDGDYHRRGIGTKLFRRLREDFDGQTITLNFSPYGLPFYKTLGFVAADKEQTVNGIRFTPMELFIGSE